MLQEQSTPQPDLAAIRADLEWMTRRWSELPERAMFELRAIAENRTPQTAKFSVDWIDDAIEWAATVNKAGMNVYAVRNPIRDSATGSADDADIIGAFYLWADCDDAEASANVKAFVGPKWTAAVITGQTPCTRVHVYFELDEPTYDLDAWRDMQARIAAHLKSDGKVINPSRIMRVGGTISWPAKHKIAKGYISELATIRTEYPEGRKPVSMDQMDRAFAPIPRLSQLAMPQVPGGFQIDTGDRAPSLDRERLAIQAMQGQEWHNAVIRLVASYVAKGLSDAEIHALTQPLTLAGYTGEETAREVQTAIDGARRKGWTPDAFPTPVAPPNQQQEASPFNLSGLSRAALSATKPRRWLYGHKLIRGFCAVLGSPGGTGKSAYAAAIAADLATGAAGLHDRPHAKLNTWVYNLEDPLDETLRKFAALAIHRNLQDSDLSRIMPMSGRDRSLILAQEIARDVIVASPDVEAVIAEIKAKQIDVLVVDPFVRAHRLSENDNKHIDFLMDLFAKIAHEGNCAVLLIHHSRKGFVGGDADSFRGGSSMTSAARIALTLQTMTEEEAIAFGVPYSERRSLVRIDNAKANLAPPPGTAEWIKLESVKIENGDEEYPDGDYVQVAVRWNPPDAWDGIGEAKALEILDKIKAGHVNEAGQCERFSARPQDKERWVGNAILSSFPPGDKTVEQAKQIIRTWLEKGVIGDTAYYSEAQRKERRGVEVLSLPGPVQQ